ncbi:MAG: hypothetical protein ACKO37_05040 [Vampirovibrionales bacterium]
MPPELHLRTFHAKLVASQETALSSEVDAWTEDSSHTSNLRRHSLSLGEPQTQWVQRYQRRVAYALVELCILMLAPMSSIHTSAAWSQYVSRTARQGRMVTHVAKLNHVLDDLVCESSL